MTNQNNASQAATKDIREGFELTYAANADDPACADDLLHFTNGWRACIMSQVGKPVVMKLEVDATAAIDLINDEVARLRAPVADERELREAAQAFLDALKNVVRFAVESLDDRDALVAASVRLRAALASAPVAKPKRAPLDDWRVQAIAECLETEWDDMTPASAEADARLIVGYLTAYEKESDQIEARHAAEPVDPVVQAVRNLRASAPVAGEAVAWLKEDGSDAWTDQKKRNAAGHNGTPGARIAESYNVPLFRHAAPQASAEAFDFVAHLARQAEFSALTFGPGARVAGVCDHIRKELIEVETSGGDLKEWVDVIILGLDGAWRSGATPQEIIAAIVAKQAKNEARTWPDWRTVDPTKAIEHDRGGQP